MDNFIDMHCHCLPGVDDGAADVEESLQMILSAYADGIHEIICTPHFHYRRGKVDKETLEKVFAGFCELVWQRCPGMQLHLGQELYYDGELGKALSEGGVCTLANSEYVLLEFSPGVEFAVMQTAVLEMIQEGYCPILAHIERYECVRKTPLLAKRLTELGACLQVNADAVIGNAGWKTKKLIQRLFRENLVSFVATDAHDTTERSPGLSRCAAFVAGKYGEEVAKRCFYGNQKMLLAEAEVK